MYDKVKGSGTKKKKRNGVSRRYTGPVNRTNQSLRKSIILTYFVPYTVYVHSIMVSSVWYSTHVELDKLLYGSFLGRVSISTRTYTGYNGLAKIMCVS